MDIGSVHTPQSLYGSSPGSGRADRAGSSADKGARKLLRRIQWDSGLNEEDFTVGLLETREQAERKSGAGAWSLRVHSSVVEHPFPEFVARFEREGEEVPFHRIAWFKQNGVLVWEADHLRHKLGEQAPPPHQHHHSYPGQHGAGGLLPGSPALGASAMLLGCSPPGGSFMARLAAAGPGGMAAAAAAAAGGLAGGLPPRCTSSSPMDSSGSAATTLAHHNGQPPPQHLVTPVQWRPHRLSGTDVGGASGGSSVPGTAFVCSSASSGSWCGPAGGGGGSAPARGTPSSPDSCSAPRSTQVGFCTNGGGSGGGQAAPLLGSSPAGCAGGGLLLLRSGGGGGTGIPPATPASGSLGGMATTPQVDGGGGGRAGSASGRQQQLGPEASGLSWASGSPEGSCSSSWAGTSPLAAAAAATLPRPHASSNGGSGACGGSWPGGGGAPLGDHAGMALALGAQGVGSGQLLAGAEPAEPPPLADYAELPEECWANILQRLGVRELCCAARVNTALRALSGRSCLWVTAYERLFGSPPPADWSGPTVKRLCRRSELRASRWLEADVEARSVGFSGTTCCQLDESKVVSGDGCAVRLWAHETGRRIATLRGHGGRVTAVTFDEEHILSGCSQGAVKLWAMDELKLAKSLRHHTGPVSATLLLHGLPISGGKDGAVCLWDVAAPNSPLVVLEAGGAVHSMQVLEERGYLVTGSMALGVWDMETTQLLFTLDAPAAPSSSLLPSSAGVAAAAAPALAAAAAPAAGLVGGGAAEVGGGGGGELEADDSLLLHDGWLLHDDDDDASDSGLDDEDDGSEEGDQAPLGLGLAPAAAGPSGGNGAAAAGGGQAGGGPGSVSTSSRSAARPWTGISCHGNLLAAGRAGGVVLWDVRTQDPVGMITPASSGGGSGRHGASSSKSRYASCVGVQLDDWRLVTGFAAAPGSAGRGSGGAGGHGGGGGSSGGAPCWWQNGGEAWGGGEGGAAAPSSGHSLEVYDIRAAGSFSSAAKTGPAAGCGGDSEVGRTDGRLWSAAPLMSLPVPSRVTCFQFHSQNLLVGQEGADCCRLSFHPPGSRSGRAAAAWGYGGPGGGGGGPNGSLNGYAAAGVPCYGASPGGPCAASSPGGAYGFGGAGGLGVLGEDGTGGAAGSSGGGRKDKKKGGTKVPAKKQTRYPKRATR